MDAIHYDKIADKLIQFRSKIPHQDDLGTKMGKNAVIELKNKIDNLLWLIDHYAMTDNIGWIR